MDVVQCHHVATRTAWKQSRHDDVVHSVGQDNLDADCDDGSAFDDLQHGTFRHQAGFVQALEHTLDVEAPDSKANQTRRHVIG